MGDIFVSLKRSSGDSYRMPKCEHCGFGHALPDRCVDCGSTDPFPRRRIVKLIVLLLSLAAAGVAVFYFYERTKELKIAEERAKAVGERVYEAGAELPASAEGGEPENAGGEE